MTQRAYLSDDEIRLRAEKINASGVFQADLRFLWDKGKDIILRNLGLQENELLKNPEVQFMIDLTINMYTMPVDEHWVRAMAAFAASIREQNTSSIDLMIYVANS